MSTSESRAKHSASIFYDPWIVTYWISSNLLTDNDTQHVSKFFKTICNSLGLKHLTTTASHTQTNGNAERYTSRLFMKWHHYVNEHLWKWDIFLQRLTYTLNTQLNHSAGKTPISLELSMHLPCPTTSHRPSSLPTDKRNETTLSILRSSWLDCISVLWKKLTGSWMLSNKDTNIITVVAFAP